MSRTTPTRILRQPEVERRTGVSSDLITLLEEKNQFPRRVPLTARTVGWVEAEVDGWIQERIALRDDAAKAEQLKIDRAPPAVRHRLRQPQQREETDILAGLQRAELTERERAGDVWADVPPT
jgi:prophage regulatory protein